MNAGDGSIERRRGGWRNRWRRRSHRPLAVCLRLLRGELHPERNRYRDVLIAIMVAVTAWSVITATSATRTARRATATATRATAVAARATATAHRAIGLVQEGRTTSIGVICAVESAIGQAGKETITGGGLLPPALDVFLQAHGFPPPAVRQAASRQQAARYIGSIGTHIERELRQRGRSPKLARRLLRPDGTLDCRELSTLANVHVR